MFGGWIFMYQLFWFLHLRISGFWLFWPIDIWAHSTSGRRYPELKITNKDGNAAVLPNLIHPNLPKTNSLRLQDGRAVDERLLESHLIKFLLRKFFRQLTQYSLPLVDIFRGLRGPSNLFKKQERTCCIPGTAPSASPDIPRPKSTPQRRPNAIGPGPRFPQIGASQNPWAKFDNCIHV